MRLDVEPDFLLADVADASPMHRRCTGDAGCAAAAGFGCLEWLFVDGTPVGLARVRLGRGP
eukprot:3631577-Pyramimonas_sp.AAC.1